MKRLFWLMLAIGSWVGCAFLAHAKTFPPSVIFFISALGWLFLAIAIGGKKGLTFGLVPVVLIGVIYFGWFFYSQAPGLFKQPVNIYEQWSKAKIFLDTLENKPLAIAGIYSVVIIVILMILAVPVIAGKRVWQELAKVKEKVVKEKKTRIKVRGRIGVG